MFFSPMGWIVLALVQLVLGSYFTISFNQYFEILSINGVLPDHMGITQFVGEGIFGTCSVLLIFVIPFISMRTISDELKDKTMALLMSAPISMTEIILGKFIALFFYHSLIVMSLVLMIFLLSLWVNIDYGFVLANTIGLWLLVCSASSVGLFFSTQTKYAVIAGFLSFLTLGSFVAIGRVITADDYPVLAQISLMNHYHHFTQGMINTHDIIYFLLFTFFFITMAVNRLHLNRVNGH